MTSFKSFLRVLLTIIVLFGVFFGYNPISKTQAQSTTYYLAPTGNDSNTGTSAAPWLTLRKAQTYLTAGTTLILKGGDYNSQSFTSQNDGTSSAPITIKNASGETPVIYAQTGAQFILTKKYYIIEGLQFKVAAGATPSEFIYMTDAGATNNIIRNNMMIGNIINSTTASPTTNGIVLRNGANYNTIQGNTVSNLGSNPDGYGPEGNNILVVSASYNKILDNTILYGWHQGIGIWNKNGGGANYNEVRRNTLNMYYGSGIGLQTTPGLGTTADRNLIENNIINHTGDGISASDYKTGIQFDSAYNTVRGNVIYNGNWQAMTFETSAGYPTSNNAVYNNTIFNNRTECIKFSHGSNPSVIVNNTFTNNICYNNDKYRSPSDPWNKMEINFVENGYPWSTFAGGNTFKNNLIQHVNNGDVVINHNDYWTRTLAQAQNPSLSPNTSNVFSGNIEGNPLFVSTDPANANFLRLQATSPAINSALAVSGPDDATFGAWNGGAVIKDIGAYQYGASPTPALTLTKSADKASVKSGDIITYTINYTATATVTNLNITDPIPSGTTYVTNSANPPATFANYILTWSLGNKAVGTDSVTFQVTVN